MTFKMIGEEESSSSDEFSAPEDPLEKLSKMEAQQELHDDDDETLSTEFTHEPVGPLPEETGDTDPQERSRNRREVGEEREESDSSIIARVIAERLAAIDNGDDGNSVASAPEDPLERLQRLEDEVNEEHTEGKVGQQDKERQSKHEKGSKKKREKANDDELDEDEKDLVRRIVELRIVAIEAEEIGEVDVNDEGERTSSSVPEDPLVRIMNMNAEDALIAAMALMQYSYESEPEEGDLQENQDVVVRTRDIFDLNNMIQQDDLEDLEKRAMTLAQSVKARLVDDNSEGARLAENSAPSHVDIGYFALAKDAANRSYSPDAVNVDIHEVQNSQHPSENRMTFIQHYLDDSPKKQSVRVSATPSELVLEDYVDVQSQSNPSSPRKKLISSHTDVSLADWWGVVGDFASLRGGSDTWESDSQSNLSLTSTESAASIDEGRILKSGGNEGGIDWDGIKSAIQQQYETSVSAKEGFGVSTLDEKRRRKRELEELKLTIVKSSELRESDAWIESLVKSGL